MLDPLGDLRVRLGELIGRLRERNLLKIVNCSPHPQSRLDVPLSGSRGGIIVVTAINLIKPNIVFKGSYRDRTRATNTAVPKQIQAIGDAIREAVDVLVPGAVEVADKKHVVIHGALLLLNPGPTLAFNNEPTGKVNDGKIKQATHQRRISPSDHEEQSVDPCVARMHRRQHIHAISFSCYVGHYSEAAEAQGCIDKRIAAGLKGGAADMRTQEFFTC